jgi:hypothetical protein
MKLVLNAHSYPIMDIHFGVNNYNKPVDLIVDFANYQDAIDAANIYGGTIDETFKYRVLFGQLDIETIIQEVWIDGDTLPGNIYELLDIIAEGPKYPKM